MGFRNPITTASAADTGTSPTGPGVRMYQDSSGQFPRGVVEWRDGIAGHDPATAVLTSLRTAPDPFDGSVVSQGNRWEFTGGSSNGIAGARVAVNIEEAAAGGYQSVVRLTADRLDLNGPLEVDALTSTGAPLAVAGIGNALTATGLVDANNPSTIQMPAAATPIIRGGSTVLTLNVNANGTIQMPPFPNGVASVVAVPGDTAGNLNAVQIIGVSKSSYNIRGTTPGGTLAPNVTVRVNWLALGW